MSIIKIRKHENNFVILQKTVLEMPKLSWKAKGLWAYLLSRIDNWEVNVKHLKSHFPGGKDLVLGMLKEH